MIDVGKIIGYGFNMVISEILTWKITVTLHLIFNIDARLQPCRRTIVISSGGQAKGSTADASQHTWMQRWMLLLILKLLKQTYKLRHWALEISPQGGRQIRLWDILGFHWMNSFHTALGSRLRNNIYRNVYLVNDTLEQLLNVYVYMITGLLLLDFGIKFNALLFLDFF